MNHLLPVPFRRLIAIAVVVATGASVAGCSDDTATSTTTVTSVGGSIVVSAAASLTGTFPALGKEFETAHPGMTITFNFDSSGTLATQIISGAPADVFASADNATMTKLSDAKLIDGAPVTFAKNQLAIVTKPGNPTHVTAVADLAQQHVVALCAETAPCGKYAAQILGKAGVTIPTASITRGQNAKATLTAVSPGDADAGVVYVTDAKAAGSKVQVVSIPTDQNAVAIYPIATVSASTNKALARAFVQFVNSPDAQRELRAAGFLSP